jgi:hypothetical protein
MQVCMHTPPFEIMKPNSDPLSGKPSGDHLTKGVAGILDPRGPHRRQGAPAGIAASSQNTQLK